MESGREKTFRILTWNVNGIRNPFGYHPWRENKTYKVIRFFFIIYLFILFFFFKKILKVLLQSKNSKLTQYE